MVQFGFHLESDYMIKLLNEKIKENACFTDEFILLISSSLNAQEQIDLDLLMVYSELKEKLVNF